MNWYNEKKMIDQYAEEKRWVFSFDLSEWRRMPDWKRKWVPDHRSNVLKELLPQHPSAHPRNTKDPSIWGWAKRVRRVEMNQLREGWRSSTRDNVIVVFHLRCLNVDVAYIKILYCAPGCIFLLEVHTLKIFFNESFSNPSENSLSVSFQILWSVLFMGEQLAVSVWWILASIWSKPTISEPLSRYY